jgi:hypothetical protein
MKKPDWFCRNEAQRKLFEAWTNARLDEMSEPSVDDLRRDVAMMSDQKFSTTTEENFGQRHKRGRVLIAAKAKDHEALAKLADTLELRRLAFRPRQRGRARGERRPGDLPAQLKASCAEAAAEVQRIRAVWQRHYDRRNRSHSPTAIEIAARRRAIPEEKLIRFMKNIRRP